MAEKTSLFFLEGQFGALWKCLVIRWISKLGVGKKSLLRTYTEGGGEGWVV